MDNNRPPGSVRSRSVWKNAMLFTVAGVMVFFSVRIRPLESHPQQEKEFDVVTYVDGFLRDSLPGRVHTAPGACMLFSRLSSGTDADWASMGHQAAIGSRYCFLTYGTGIVEQVEESGVVLKLIATEGPCTVRIATAYIFGNEVRNATGMIRLEDFGDLTTFNRISELINERIRTQVLPSFVDEVQVRDTVFVAGACCINKRLMDMDTVELVPVDLKIYR